MPAVFPGVIDAYCRSDFSESRRLPRPTLPEAPFQPHCAHAELPANPTSLTPAQWPTRSAKRSSPIAGEKCIVVY